jgi:hypothetical protein
MRKLRGESRAGMLKLAKGDLRWSVVDFEEVRVLDHAARPGLQLADIGAGAFFQAVERDRPGECDPQYTKLLSRIVAKNADGHYIPFGIKPVPELWEMEGLLPQQREIFEFYGFNPDGWQAAGS